MIRWLSTIISTNYYPIRKDSSQLLTSGSNISLCPTIHSLMFLIELDHNHNLIWKSTTILTEGSHNMYTLLVMINNGRKINKIIEGNFSGQHYKPYSFSLAYSSLSCFAISSLHSHNLSQSAWINLSTWPFWLSDPGS